MSVHVYCAHVLCVLTAITALNHIGGLSLNWKLCEMWMHISDIHFMVAVSEAVIYRHLIVKALARSRTTECEICTGQNDTGTGFYRNFRLSFCFRHRSIFIFILIVIIFSLISFRNRLYLVTNWGRLACVFWVSLWICMYKCPAISAVKR
jgi:hypothetical protein